MSLPPALLKRLASRGLVKPGNSLETPLESKDEVLESEEIIAEDYDEIEYPSQYDSYEPARRTEENFWIERMKLRIGDVNLGGCKGCPNKYNIYHKCNLFCVTRWGNGIVDPDRGYLKRKARLLKKYSLPKGWKEVYDPGCGCFYYWNTINNNVAWLPPSHPKSNVTKSAAVFRRQLEDVSPLGDEENMDEDDDSNPIDEEETNMQPRSRSKSPPTNRLKSDVRNQNVLGIKKPRNRDLDKTIRQKEIKRYRDRNSASGASVHKPTLPKQTRDNDEIAATRASVD